MVNLKKAFKENTVGFVIILIIGIYVAYIFLNYLNSKKNAGYEMLNNNSNMAYKNSTSSTSNGNGNAVSPSEPLGQNEVFASVKGIQTSQQGMPTSCNKANITNPEDLLPKDTNGQWSQLNPSGQGMLSNINLLKAGYHIGIDSVGQSLRNANQQIRSEPPNPQMNVSVWNNSTISPDFLRVPLEIGSCSQ